MQHPVRWELCLELNCSDKVHIEWTDFQLRR